MQLHPIAETDIEFFTGHQFAKFDCGSMICSYVIGIKIPSQFFWL